MAWEEVTPAPKGATPGAEARVGMFSIRGSAPRLFILLRGPVLDAIEGGVSRFRVDVGSVEHKHLVRIRADKDGPFAPLKMPGRSPTPIFRLALPPSDRFPICSIKAQQVDWKHDKVGKCLLVNLPAWAWDDGQKREMEQRAARLARGAGS